MPVHGREVSHVENFSGVELHLNVKTYELHNLDFITTMDGGFTCLAVVLFGAMNWIWAEETADQTRYGIKFNLQAETFCT